MTAPDLTIVVVVHDMAREAPRTLHSLSAGYQRGVGAHRYEVIVVDNGSAEPLGAAAVAAHGANFRYVEVAAADASPSPAAALNLGASQAAGRWLGLLVDGARIVTPGTVGLALAALERDPAAAVETVGFHLGPDIPRRARRSGYDQAAEDALLDGIGWPADGYRLFEVAVLTDACRGGWFRPISESTCMFLGADAFARHGGFDERFDAPGGGLVNLDFYLRLAEDETLAPVRLLGEANFHQVHGGAATGLGSVALAARFRGWKRQYRQIRGQEYRPTTRMAALYGYVGPEAAPWLARSAELLAAAEPAATA